ncbi:MAG: ATP-binding protein [Pirellulaceae bacterium]|nr:ATP-binding protein [Pirellulaceae bacterium]
MSQMNPFLRAIVADPWEQHIPDVPRIHARAFEACRTALEMVRRTGATQSVLVHGEPGSGKTHLLARLRSHLAGQGASHPPQSNLPPLPPALFSGLRLRAGSRMICRHLRRAVTGDLLRRVDQGPTQLDWLLISRASRYVNKPEMSDRWWARLRLPDRAEQASEEAQDLMDRLVRDCKLPGNLATVLKLWALGRCRRAVRDWLAEGTLPEAELAALGLLPMPDEADPEEEALDLIESLSRLAGPELPLVLCFDQVEALQADSRDLEGPFAFGRMMSALHDRTQHMLLITGVQSTFLETMEQAIRTADMDRLRETLEVLEPLDAEQARLLVAERLLAAGRREDPLAPDRIEDPPREAAPSAARGPSPDPCWPIGSAAVDRFVASGATGSCTPRRLLAFCRQQYERWRTGRDAPRIPPEQTLQRQFDTAFEQALRGWNPSRSDETLSHGLPLALLLVDPSRTAARADVPEADFAVQAREGRATVIVCNDTGNRLTGRLKRLREHVQRHGGGNLVLVRDARIPVPRTARKADEHLRALAQHGVPLVRPAADAMAALDALRGLLADARSGDLTHDGQTLAEATVRDWLVANLPSSLKELLDELIPADATSGPDPLYDGLLEVVQQRHLVRASEVAEQLDCDLEQIARCLERNRDRFGVLAGPPLVIFERIEV